MTAKINIGIVFLLCFPIISFASNAQLVKSFSDIIQTDSHLSDDRKEALSKIVSEVIYGSSIGSDKLEMASGHFQTYVKDSLSGVQEYNDEQFGIVKDTFQWALKNYVALPQISETDKDRAIKSIQESNKALRKFVHDTYTDTPLEVREQLALKIEGRINEELLAKVGNYFYVQTLYPKEKQITNNEIVQQLHAHPFIQDNSKKFASTASILDNNSIPESSHKPHIEAFLHHQAAILYPATQKIIKKQFDASGKLKDYESLPYELQHKWQGMLEELRVTAQERHKKIREQNEHKNLLRELLDETGIELEDGIVVVPSMDDLSVVENSIDLKNIHEVKQEAKTDIEKKGSGKDTRKIGTYNLQAIVVAYSLSKQDGLMSVGDIEDIGIKASEYKKISSEMMPIFRRLAKEYGLDYIIADQFFYNALNENVHDVTKYIIKDMGLSEEQLNALKGSPW